MSQNLGKSSALKRVQIAETDSCMVSQNSQYDLDAFGLKACYISCSASIFEQIGHFVIKIKNRITNFIAIIINTFLPTNVCGEEFHNICICFSIGENIITCIERVYIVRLHIDGNFGSLVPVGSGYNSIGLPLLNSRLFCLLAGTHKHCSYKQSSHKFQSLFHNALSF